MALFDLRTIQAIAGVPAALIVLKATAVTTVGLTGSWLARRNCAAMRHLLLAATFGVLLALPVASSLLPALSIAVSTGAPEQALTLPASTSAIELSQPASAARPLRGAPVLAGGAGVPVPAVAAGVWVAGAIIFSTPFLAGAWKLRSLCRSAKPWVRGQLVVNELARESGMTRSVGPMVHEGLPGPMTCGVFRPKIVLPLAAERWEREELKRVLIHELEHVRRCDWLVQCVSRAVCSVYWFHPLVWAAWRRLSLEAERSCDDAVLRDSESTAYADQLVALAHRMMTNKSPVPAMANRSDLATRVRSVLDGNARRGKAGGRFLSFACAIALAVLMLVSPIRLVSAPWQSVGSSSASTSVSAAAETAADTPGQAAAVPTPSERAATGRLKFDAVSIKQNQSGAYWSQVTPIREGVGRYTARNITLRNLISSVYGVYPVQIIGGGRPMLDTERWDIEAAVDAQPSRQEVIQMLQAVLADRFQVEMHFDSREIPRYALLAPKTGLKLGAHVAKADGRDCSTPGGSGCRAVISGPQSLAMEHVNFPLIATTLSQMLNTVVVDETGLDGRYDIKLDLDLERFGTGEGPSFAEFVDSVTTALREQAGLRLEPRKGLSRVLVIDRAEEPTEN